MLTYDMNERGRLPMYEYLYICIRDDIVSGRLSSNEKLPSKRQLAANLGISLITVQNAYEQLLVEGYIFSKERQGYFVSEIVTGISAPVAADSKPQTSDNDSGLVMDFTSSHIIYDNFPYSMWARLMRQTLLDEQGAFLKSPNHQGVRELREAIAEHLREFRGLSVNPENIIVGAGTEYLYSMIVQLIGRSGMIAVEDPGHLKVAQVYESCGVKVVHIPVDEHGMSAERLKDAQVMAVHLSPSHQFPTGSVMSASRRHSIISWAREHDRIIIEDDYDSEFRFTGRPISTMASLDQEHVIYMNTFSRTLSPSIRIAYMVLPGGLMVKYRQRLGFYSCTVSGMEQFTLARFISGGYYGRHLNRMRNYYRNKRNIILEAINGSRLSQHVSIEEEDAGLHFLLRVNKEIDDEAYTATLLEHGIRITPVSKYCYRPQEKYNHRFIINYSAVDAEGIEEAFDTMAEIL